MYPVKLKQYSSMKYRKCNIWIQIPDRNNGSYPSKNLLQSDSEMFNFYHLIYESEFLVTFLASGKQQIRQERLEFGNLFGEFLTPYLPRPEDD